MQWGPDADAKVCPHIIFTLLRTGQRPFLLPVYVAGSELARGL